MTEAILRLALTTNGGKWEPGTILAAYPPTQRLNAMEMAGFALVKIETDQYTLEELRAMRRKKMLALDSLFSPTDKQTMLEQVENIRLEKVAHDGWIIKVENLTHKPDLAVKKNLSTLSDVPEKYKPAPDPIIETPTEGEIARFG
jgi:hypothetical protein